jgi:beta-galactosidase
MPSRRHFLSASATAALCLAPARAASPTSPLTAEWSLEGLWEFRLDASRTWRPVRVPHTWQIEPGNEEYMGVAWYRREFDVPVEWKASIVRVEFEAVFHTATVMVNDREVGRHAGKGYTAFEFDITPKLRFGAKNSITVRVDNSYSDTMLPRAKSSDWTHDGGIYRPVRLLVTPEVYLERVDVEAYPDPSFKRGSVQVRATIRNASASEWKGAAGYRVVDQQSGNPVWPWAAAEVSVAAGATRTVALAMGLIDPAKLWHFDDPNLYRAEAELRQGGRTVHAFDATFGVRSFEVKPDGFYLNGEHVRLMGVERMAGSNPEFGMAEPEWWITHDHDDMKELNCVYTRVHWPQDRRLLDYCDAYGILIQLEVPAWGPNTFQGMKGEPSPAIMENGLEQLRAMIARDRNHPCVVSWGVCNEVNGQNPPAYQFVKRLYEEAKRLDPRRPATYASHSLFTSPEKDVAGLMDFIEWNQYFGSWQKGGVTDLRRTLDQLHAAFPNKPIVISEYGYCACTADRPEGDEERVAILRDQTRMLRERDYVAGLIFFCYNDYRTHVGDKGLGVAKQRVHGVVDLFGTRKPSYALLREESSPVAVLEIAGDPARVSITVAARKTVPAYTLRGYKVRGVLYGRGAIPLERAEAELPALKPGEHATVYLSFQDKAPLSAQFDVLRPNGYSALTRWWR